MRKLIITTILAFAFCFSHGQIYQKNATWYEWNRARFNELLRIPKDTLPTADSGAIAVKGGVVYVKNQKWERVGGLPGSFVDTLYQGDDLDLVYRKGGVTYSLWGAFMNLYTSDGAFETDRQIDGQGFGWTNMGFKKFLFLTDNVAGHKSFSEFVMDEYGSNLKMAYNDPAASGTNNYLSYSHISQKPAAAGKSYMDLYAMRQTSPSLSTRMHNHLIVYPDSTVFAAYSNESTLRSLIVKWYGLQRGTASTDSLLVRSADGTTKVRALTDAGTSSPTPNLQAVATVGSTTTTPITANSFLTTNSRVQLLENGTAGAMFLYNNSGTLVGYFAGNTVGASYHDIYQVDPASVSTIADAGRLIANANDSARPYWKDRYGTLRKIAFYGENTGGGGSSLTTTDNNLTISSNTISTKKSVQTFTDAGTITIDCANGYNWKGTIAGNRTLSVTNMQEGQYLTIEINQDATGSRTITLPAGWKVINGGNGAVSLSTAGGAKDALCVWYDGVNYLVTIGKNYN